MQPPSLSHNILWTCNTQLWQWKAQKYSFENQWFPLIPCIRDNTVSIYKWIAALFLRWLLNMRWLCNSDWWLLWTSWTIVKWNKRILWPKLEKETMEISSLVQEHYSIFWIGQSTFQFPKWGLCTPAFLRWTKLAHNAGHHRRNYRWTPQMLHFFSFVC